MRAILLALALVLAHAATARAQDRTPVVIVLARPAPAPQAFALAEPRPLALGAPAATRRGRRSVGAVVATGATGGALLAGGWVITFVGTIGWYFDTTDCRGASVSLFGPDPDGPYRCEHRGPNDDALGASFIPIAGPWIMLTTPGIDPAFPVTMGVIQAAGLLTLAIGLPLAWAGSSGESVEVGVGGEAGGARLVVSGRF